MTTILVVEDEKQIREDLVMLLQLEGYEVHEAVNGAEAWLSIQQARPDFICCDVVMPVMDGYDLLKRVRADDQTRDIPFIFISAMAASTDIQRGLDAEANGYLSKPFAVDQLLGLIHELLSTA